MPKMLTDRPQPQEAPPHPQRRASDLIIITLDELGPLAPGQRARVLARDAAVKEAMPSTAAIMDADLRKKFLQWGMYEQLAKLDEKIAERRRAEEYGVVFVDSLDYVLDTAFYHRKAR